MAPSFSHARWGWEPLSDVAQLARPHRRFARAARPPLTRLRVFTPEDLLQACPPRPAHVRSAVVLSHPAGPTRTMNSPSGRVQDLRDIFESVRVNLGHLFEGDRCQRFSFSNSLGR